MIRRYLLMSLFLSSVLLAGDIGGYAGSFLRVGTTARSLAMGGGLTADLDNGFPAYYNPAAIAFLPKRHVSVFHHFLQLDRYLVSAAFSSALPPSGGIGVGILNAGVKGIQGRNQAGHETGTFSTEEYAVYFSFANQLFQNISFGVNVKLFYQVLPVDGRQVSKGTGVDLAVLMRRSRKFQLGLVIQDWNAGYAWNTSEVFDEKGSSYQDEFPTQVRLGFAYHPGLFDVYGDYTFFSAGENTTASRIRAGGEYRPMERVSVRAGMNNFSPTVGGGLNYSLINRDDSYVDYAFLLGRRGEGVSHVFTYIFTF